MQINKNEKYELAVTYWNEVIDKLRSNRSEYAKYLKFTSRIYKHRFQDTLMIYRQNPNATKVAELKQWNTVGRFVNRGEHSIVTFGNNHKCKYLFDVSQTNGEKEPSIWKLDRELSEKLVSGLNHDMGETFQNLDESIASMCTETARSIIQVNNLDFYKSLTPEERKKFNHSLLSATRFIVSGRCSLDSDIETNNSLNLEVFDICKDKQSFLKFAELVHVSAQSVLSQIEKKVLEINKEKIIENEKSLSENNSKLLVSLTKEIIGKSKQLAELVDSGEFSQAAEISKELSKLNEQAEQLKKEIQGEKITVKDVEVLRKIEPKRKSVQNMSETEVAKTPKFEKLLNDEMGEKSAYEMRNGNNEWREDESKTVPIIKVRKRDIPENLTEMQKRKDIPKGTFVNKDTGIEIQFGKRAIGEIVSKTIQDKKRKTPVEARIDVVQ